MQFFELFYTFFYIGIVTFGGGYAMLPLIQSTVLEKGWMPHEQLVDFVAISESTPGPFAINIATYIGAERCGVLGSVCATLGVVMPSFIIILLVARVYEKFNSNRIVKGVMIGLKPAVIGLIASAVLTIGKTVLIPDVTTFMGVFSKDILSLELLCSLIIFALGLFLILKKKAHPILVIVISALLGILAGYFIL
ncbi:MAG: chromate transporter [Clostridia bacterium]|nr:chromate transporter [Clostridia bacterium]